MKFSLRGEVHPYLGDDDLTFGEMDLLERTAGMSAAQIRRVSNTCVCGCPVDGHRVRDERRTTCTVCQKCSEFERSTPTRITAIRLWLGVRRATPELSFEEFSDIPMDAFDFAADEPDPTPPPPGE